MVHMRDKLPKRHHAEQPEVADRKHGRRAAGHGTRPTPRRRVEPALLADDLNHNPAVARAGIEIDQNNLLPSAQS